MLSFLNTRQDGLVYRDMFIKSRMLFRNLMCWSAKKKRNKKTQLRPSLFPFERVKEITMGGLDRRQRIRRRVRANINPTSSEEEKMSLKTLILFHLHTKWPRRKGSLQKQAPCVLEVYTCDQKTGPHSVGN